MLGIIGHNVMKQMKFQMEWIVICCKQSKTERQNYSLELNIATAEMIDAFYLVPTILNHVLVYYVIEQIKEKHFQLDLIDIWPFQLYYLSTIFKVLPYMFGHEQLVWNVTLVALNTWVLQLCKAGCEWLNSNVVWKI